MIRNVDNLISKVFFLVSSYGGPCSNIFIRLCVISRSLSFFVTFCFPWASGISRIFVPLTLKGGDFQALVWHVMALSHLRRCLIHITPCHFRPSPLVGSHSFDKHMFDQVDQAFFPCCKVANFWESLRIDEG